MSETNSRLPTGWVESTVGEALSIRNNLRFPISTEERLKIQGEFPYYGPTGILSHISSYRLDGEFATIGEDGDHFLKYRERSMTLLISGKFNVNNHAHVLASTEKCEASWFANYYMHQELTPFLTRQGAGRYKLTKAALERLPILLPPIDEQRKIANILSQWDGSLFVLSQLIDAKRQQKRGLAAQLLTGKRRLPRFEEEWSAHPLGFLLLSKQKVRAGKVDYPILSVTIDGVKRQGDQFNKRVASENIGDYLVIERGEIAMSGLNFWMGAIGMQSIVDAGVISPAYKVFKVNGQLMNSEYAMHFVRSETMLGILLESSVQGASIVRRNLDMKALTSAPVRLPSLLEQQAIAAVLSTLDSEIAALETLKDKVAEQKRGLMDALLTGRVRVNVEDAS